MSWTKGLGRLPGIATARGYHREWLRTDITAGLVLTALLIPAGMGYAEAAGLPAYAGLYATIVPLLAYALVGPSKILVLGPDSSLAPLIAAAILPLAIVGDEDNALALAGVLAILVGLILLIGGSCASVLSPNCSRNPSDSATSMPLRLWLLSVRFPNCWGSPLTRPVCSAK